MTAVCIRSSGAASALLFCFLLVQNATAATRDELAAKPPMGFNSYYMRGPYINEALIRGMADYLYTNKLSEMGYRFVVIDEGWSCPADNPNGRDANGRIVPDPTRFPNMPGLIEYIHSKGLLAGIYTEDTLDTAAGFVGSSGHFEQDAATFAEWGVDFIKFDVYNTVDYLRTLAEFSSAVDRTGRPMVLYSGVNGYANHGADPQVLDFVNSYRFVGDVGCMYERFTNAVFYGSSIPEAVRPGRWVDYDAFGWNAGGQRSAKAMRSCMGMYSILSAPLMLPAFLDQRLYPAVYAAITNLEVIAVDQDPAGVQGRCISTNGLVTLWVKPLGQRDGARKAVAVMNMNTSADEPFSFSWADIGMPPGVATVRNLWDRTTTYCTNSLMATVPAGDLALFRISPGVEPFLPPGITFLSDLQWLPGSFNGSTNGLPQGEYGFPVVIYRDACLDPSKGTRPLQLKGRRYAKGLGLFANGHIEFYLGGLADRFHCLLGVDDGGRVGDSLLRFQVKLDGLTVLETPTMTRGDEPVVVDLPIPNVQNLAIDTLTMRPDGTIWETFADVCDAYVTVSSAYPALTMQTMGGTVTVSWPTNYPSYTLESTDRLSGTPWSTVDVVPETIQGTNSVVVRESAGCRYFRLRKLE